MKFVRDHFDKILLFVVFCLIYAGYLVYNLPPLEQLLRDLVVAILTLVGVRRLTDAAHTTTIAAESVEVNQPKNEPAITSDGENTRENEREILTYRG